MEIVNLIENKSIRNSIKCEHGLSLHIRLGDKNVLFDVGQSDKFIRNASLLGVVIEEVDYVVLSHGHFDHTGGLPAFLKLNKKAKVFLHREALRERFSRSSKITKANGIPWRLDWEKYKGRFCFVEDSFELFKGLWIVSGIQRDLKLCELDDRLIYKGEKGYESELFDDELVLYVDNIKAATVVTGCAHKGIVNILNGVQSQLGVSRFELVVGGLHLMGKSNDEVNHLLNQLKSFEVRQWALNHCTGDPSIERFSTAYPGKVRYFKGGESILLD